MERKSHDAGNIVVCAHDMLPMMVVRPVWIRSIRTRSINLKRTCMPAIEQNGQSLHCAYYRPTYRFAFTHISLHLRSDSEGLV